MKFRLVFQIEKDKLIEFVNIVNECCAVMDHDYVAEWLTTPNSNLNMEPPMQLINDESGKRKGSPAALLYRYR